MTTTQKAVLLHPMGSMGDAIADECYAGPYPLEPHQWPPAVATEPRFWNHECPGEGLTATAANEACPWCDATEEQDRAEIERINLTGARYRESVRLSQHGAEPWDYAAGDAAA